MPLISSSPPEQHPQGWSAELGPRAAALRGEQGCRQRCLCALLSFILTLTVNHSEHEGRRQAEANKLHSTSHPEAVAQFLARGSRAAALKDPRWRCHRCWGHCLSYQEHTSRADGLPSTWGRCRASATEFFQPRIAESWNGSAWKGPQWVTWAKLPAQSTGLGPDGSGMSPVRVMP